MNEVKLIDFDCETLSLVADAIQMKIESLGEALMLKECCSFKFKENYETEIDNLRTFQTQLLYAFSIVKEKENVTLN